MRFMSELRVVVSFFWLICWNGTRSSGLKWRMGGLSFANLVEM